MADILSMGANAAQVYRIALSTVSNNIANINNETFSRQQTMLSSGVPARVGVLNIGTGANVDYIHRSYNAFVEGSLRDSSSALNTQSPLIDYTSRIINIMASDDGNLLNAVDNFFSALNKLELEPKNIGLRNEVLASGESLAARIKSISGDLEGIRNESYGELEVQVDAINKAAQSLLQVNNFINRNSTLKQQSPTLLDQRDQLLREIAAYVNIDVSEQPNGAVSVRLSGPASKATLVDAEKVKLISVQSDELTNSIKGFVLDAYSEPVFIGIPQDGSTAGLIQLNNEVIEPLAQSLNDFALKFVSEVNLQHAQGLDLRNEMGNDFFRIKPDLAVFGRNGDELEAFDVETSDGVLPVRFEMSLVADGVWSLRQVGSLNEALLAEKIDEVGRYIDHEGIKIRLLDAYTVGSSFLLKGKSQISENVTVALKDSTHIATAARLRIDQDIDNAQKIQVQIDYAPPAPPVKPQLGYSLALQPNRNLDRTFVVDANKPVISVPGGFGEFEISYLGSLKQPINLQVLNSNFLHLAGSTDVDEDWITTLQNSRLYGANRYVDVAGKGFPGLNLFIGARADTSLISESIFDQDEEVRISTGAIKVNGIALNELVIDADSDNKPAEIAAWINSHNTGVSARAKNVIRVDVNRLDFKASLKINNEVIMPAIDLAELINKINSKQNTTGVIASQDPAGNLQLTNIQQQAGRSISIASNDGAENVLGISSGKYTGNVEYLADAAFKFELGNNGSSIDFANIGLRTTLYGSNSSEQSLHVYVDTTDQTFSASLKARNYLPTPERALEPAVKMQFIDDEGTMLCRMTDIETNCVIQEAEFSLDAGVRYLGVNVNFDRTPENGDEFLLIPNLDAQGDNSNLRKISSIENKQLLYGQTVRTFYLNEVDKVGAASELAKMNEIAADILFEENTKKRSAIAGVNLDEEAADLMRFQQAFQAAAQLIQTANTLFETIINAR